MNLSPKSGQSFLILPFFLSLFKVQITEDRKAEMLSEMALCKQRIQNAEKLFMMARIDEEALNRHIEENECQIVRLQAEMSETTQIKQMIEMAASMLSDMGVSWEDSSREDKQAFVQTMFSEIVFDLDTYQITGFSLKGWAEQFLQARAVYDDRQACLEGVGYAAGSLPSVKDTMQFILLLLYGDEYKIEKIELPTWEKRERNAEIYRRYLAGEDSIVLGCACGLSDRRIRDIIEKERKRSNR